MKRYRLSLITFVCCLYVNSAVGKFFAEIDNDTISRNDTVTLRIVTDQAVMLPDLAALKKDFTLVGTRQIESMQIIGGRSKRTLIWLVQLKPKKSGLLVIPALHSHGESSHALHLHVTNQQAVKPSTNSVFVRLEVSPGIPWVNQQTLLKVKVFIDNPQHIEQLALTQPTVTNAILKPLGHEKSYRERVHNQSYHVIEKQYVLFPSQIGPVTIKDVTLSGQISQSAPAQFDPFHFSFAQSKPFQRHADIVTLDVQQPPKQNTSTHWLPARQISLSSKWLSDIGSVTIGEPITREITLIAHQQLGKNIPKFKSMHMNNYRLYADQPQYTESITPEGIVTHVVQRLTYLATKPGKLVLPTMHLSWYDTVHRRYTDARLAATTIPIRKAILENKNDIVVPVLSHSPSKDTHTTYWTAGFALAGCFALLWLSTLGYFLWPSYNRTLRSTGKSNKNTLWREFETACKQQNLQQACTILIQWANNELDEKNYTNATAVLRTLGAKRAIDLFMHIESIYYGKTQATVDLMPFCYAVHNAVKQYACEQIKATLNYPNINPATDKTKRI